MAQAAPATQPVEGAAHLVAYWQDLQSVQPHELRGHLVMSRLLCAIYDGLGLDDDWHLTARFQVPMTSQPLAVTFLVGTVGADTRATMREANPKDLENHYSRAALREQLEAGDLGNLNSWGLWANAYFLNAIQRALFQPGEGAVWQDLQRHPTARAPRLARDALRPECMPDELVDRYHLAVTGDRPRLDESTITRCHLVWKRVAQLRVHIPPQNIPLDIFATRNPPPGVRRKGNALTVTELLCDHLVTKLGMEFAEAASSLGMDDWRQVRKAVQQGTEKSRKWAAKR